MIQTRRQFILGCFLFLYEDVCKCFYQLGHNGDKCPYLNKYGYKYVIQALLFAILVMQYQYCIYLWNTVSISLKYRISTVNIFKVQYQCCQYLWSTVSVLSISLKYSISNIQYSIRYWPCWYCTSKILTALRVYFKDINSTDCVHQIYWQH